MTKTPTRPPALRGAVWGLAVGLGGAAALLALGSFGGEEADIGVSYLAAFIGFPVSSALLLLVPALSYIRYWREFVVLSLVLNWSLIGLCVGTIAGLLTGYARRSKPPPPAT